VVHGKCNLPCALKEGKMRQRISSSVLISTLLILSACSPSQPQVTTVFVPTIVKETQIVEQTRIVPEIRYVTAEVTRIVRETVIVLPAPTSIPMSIIEAPPTAILQAEVIPAPTARPIIEVTPFPPFELLVNVSPGITLLLPRAQHTSTLMSDGRVILAGGSSNWNEQSIEVEIFDPATGTSSLAAPLHTPRIGHTTTLLPDGRVLVIGGSNHYQGWLADAELYDPSTNVWTGLPMLTSHGVEHTATLMSDGRVLVVGGAVSGGKQSDQVEIFDPQTDTWYGAMPLESDRASHTAQLLEDGRVLVVGGGSAHGIPAGGDALVYDPQTNTWTATGPMVNMRINGKSVRLSDGRVLVVGGINLVDSINSVRTPLTSAEIYDPISNTWSATGSLSQARYGHELTLLQDGRVLVSGGTLDGDCCSTSDSYASLIEIYDPQTGVWDPAGLLPQPGVYSAGVLLPDGRIWLTGGESGVNGSTSNTGTWLISPGLP
jgi:hypothetical protein